MTQSSINPDPERVFLVLFCGGVVICNVATEYVWIDVIVIVLV